MPDALGIRLIREYTGNRAQLAREGFLMMPIFDERQSADKLHVSNAEMREIESDLAKQAKEPDATEKR